jgi:thiol:disulfide interchange protein DsbD
MLVFTSLGLGMASPYLLCSAFPSALKYFPKPGNWMITFKEFTGFFMVGTVLWLLWVFSAQTGSSALILMLASLFFLTIGAWVYGKWGSPVRKKSTRLVGYALSLSLLLLSGTALYVATATKPTEQQIAASSNWEDFSPKRIEELRAQGIPVFVDFTAKWCLICQANHIVLTTNQVENLFNEKGVVRMKADWTMHDDIITEELRKFGRNGVPLYVYYPANGEPVLLPQVLTPDIVTNTVHETTRIAKENL